MAAASGRPPAAERRGRSICPCAHCFIGILSTISLDRGWTGAKKESASHAGARGGSCD